MLVVFDLDFTLWDADRRTIYLYPDVKSILDTLSRKEILMAVASRTHSPYIARKLMTMFDIRCCFKYEEIYPGSKTQHFEALYKLTRIPYRDMYFFDDEYRNIAEVEALGVNVCHVGAGLSWEELSMIPVK